MPATNLLTIRPSRNNGATVIGWDRNGVDVRICKFASAPTRENADALLREIVLLAADGRVEVNGPDRGNWSAHLIVQLARSGAVDVETANGPLTDLSEGAGGGQFLLVGRRDAAAERRIASHGSPLPATRPANSSHSDKRKSL